MDNFQYPGHLNQSFDNSSQTFNDVPSNLDHTHQYNEQHQYFNDASYLQNLSSNSQSPADPTSLPPPGFMHISPCQRNSTRPHPPALQTANLSSSNAFMPDSPYSGYQQSFESPLTQAQTPMTPSHPLLYTNGPATDSMTSFSPSSNTSGELDPVEGASPAPGDSPSSDIVQDESPCDGAKRGGTGGDVAERKKRNSRRMWTHSLEKYIFTPHEIATLGTPHRRTIYSASLEAHIDRLHSQLLGVDLYPVHVDDLQMYRGLNCKIAKGMVAGLQHDFVQVRTRLLEIERAMNNAREMAVMRASHEMIEAQNHVQGAHGIGQTDKHSLTLP